MASCGGQLAANNVCSSSGSAEVNQATRAINTFMPWLLILVGCLFNALIVLGMRTKNFRGLSTSVYMTVGAVNDFFSLPILLIAHWMHVNFPHSIVRGRAGHVCKFFNFYGWGQADLSMMLTSAMTADRAYVILRPMTTVDLVVRARVIVGVCVAVVSLKNFHFWFTSIMTSVDRKDRLCEVDLSSATYREFYRYYWPWVDAIFDMCCFVVMIVSNGVLISHVRKSRREGKIRAGGGGKSSVGSVIRTSSTMSIHAGSSYSSVGSQITKMLLAESLAIILLSYPFSVHLLVTSRMSNLQDDPVKARDEALAFNVVFYLLYANKCVNFLVYCRAGKKFRRAVMDEVLCRCNIGKFQFGKGRGSSQEGSYQCPSSQRDPDPQGSRSRQGSLKQLDASVFTVSGSRTAVENGTVL